MTWAAMKASPAETARRQAVAVRLNTLFSKREHTDDPKARKRLDREINRIRSNESFWLKDAAYFLY